MSTGTPHGRQPPPPKRKRRLRTWFVRQSNLVQVLVVAGIVVALIGGAAIIGLVNNARSGGELSLTEQYRNGCHVVADVSGGYEEQSYSSREIGRIFRAFPNQNFPENVPRRFDDISDAYLELPLPKVDEKPDDEVIGADRGVYDLAAACHAHGW
jgi:hypothetical protein